MAEQLPIELKNKIINYTNVVTFFKGKYYNKIPLSDERYEMLKKVIKLPKITVDKAEYRDTVVRYLQKDIGESYNTPRYSMSLIIFKNNVGDRIKYSLSFFKFNTQVNYYSGGGSSYIFSKQNKWVKTIDYYM